jgi:hypothetical protein
MPVQKPHRNTHFTESRMSGSDFLNRESEVHILPGAYCEHHSRRASICWRKLYPSVCPLVLTLTQRTAYLGLAAVIHPRF